MASWLAEGLLVQIRPARPLLVFFDLCDIEYGVNAESANGRLRDSDSRYRGSTPLSAARWSSTLTGKRPVLKIGGPHKGLRGSSPFCSAKLMTKARNLSGK